MILALLLAASAISGNGDSALTLDALLAEVQSRSPDLATQRASAEVAESAVGVAGAWEDPTVSVMGEGLGPRSEMDPAEPMTMFTYRLSVPLNVFGRRGLAKEAARARLQAERANLRRVEWDLRARAATAFYQLWMVDEMTRVVERQLDILRGMEASAKARYAAGLMGHHDVLRSQAEQARMEAELASLRSERLSMVSMLNALRNRPTETPIEPQIERTLPELPALDVLLTRADQRPETERAQAMAREAEAERARAGRMYLPMVMVAGGYEQRLRGMPDSLMGEVAFSVPLFFFDRQQNEVAMAEAMERRAQREVEASLVMGRAEVARAWSQARAADASLQALEETALPRLRETIDSAQAAYASGSGGFLELLDASMSLLDVEARRIEAAVRQQASRFEIERAIAGRLEGAP